MGEPIRYISLFSGVEACSVAWYHMKNWKAQAFAEFDAFPSAVLKYQFPHVPNVGDVTKHEWKQYKGKCELIVGGSPCQSFSVAGKRLGLDDPRGNLALHFLRIIEEVQPTWFIFENVPGLLSSDDGRDFAAFLAQVENIGYGCAYRVLDAQHFGVPQRRRRVFVVGHIDGDWRRAASVLFEPEGLQGDNPSRNKKRQASASNSGSGVEARGEYWNGRGITNTLTAKGDDDRMPDKGRFHGVVVPDITGTLDTELNTKLSTQAAQSGFLIPTQHPDEVAPTVTAKWSKGADTPPGGKIDNGNMIPVSIGVDLFNQEETGEVHVPLRTAQGHGAPAVMTFDARGNGEGDVTNTLVGDHQSRVTDFTALAVEPVEGENICFDHTFGQNAVVYEQVSPTLKANGCVPTSPAVMQRPWRMAKAPMSADDNSRWEESEAHPTLNTFSNHGENRLQSAVTIESPQPIVIDRAAYNQGENASFDPHIKESQTMPTVVARGPHAVAQEAIPIHDQATRFSGKRGDKQDGKGNGLGIGNEGDPANTLTKNDRHAVAQNTPQELAVRRLTPVECERLQGFPDNWTQIPWKNKPKEKCPDGPRFKAMSNSMAVHVRRWIGEGIELVNRIPRTEAPQQEELGWL